MTFGFLFCHDLQFSFSSKTFDKESLYSFLLIANMMTNFHWSCKNRWKNSWNESGFGTRIWQMGIGNPLWITNTHLSPPNHQSTFISRIFFPNFLIFSPLFMILTTNGFFTRFFCYWSKNFLRRFMSFTSGLKWI